MHDQDILLGEKIDNLAERFDAFEKRQDERDRKLDPILEAYDSVVFGKKFVVGLASLVGAIAVIGGVIIGAVNWIRHG